MIAGDVENLKQLIKNVEEYTFDLHEVDFSQPRSVEDTLKLRNLMLRGLNFKSKISVLLCETSLHDKYAIFYYGHNELFIVHVNEEHAKFDNVSELLDKFNGQNS